MTPDHDYTDIDEPPPLKTHVEPLFYRALWIGLVISGAMAAVLVGVVVIW